MSAWLFTQQRCTRKRRAAGRRDGQHRSMTYRQTSLEMFEPRRLMAGLVMTDQEQLLLELVNRARMNPLGEAALYSIDLNAGLAAGTISSAPKQPVAPNNLLTAAAALHSQDMLDRDYFDHFDPQGVGPGTRIANAGYVGRGWGENIAWAGSTAAIDAVQYVYKNHEALVRSPSHRENMMTANFDELGNGVRTGVFTSSGTNYNSSMVTENFGVSSNLVFITGVAFTDQVQRDNFYTIGEAVGGLTVTALSATGTTVQTQTATSGGYSLPVAAGTYTVSFSGGTLPQPISFPGIVVADENRKVDLNTALLSTLQLSLATNSISEGGGSVTATLTRTGSLATTLTVLMVSSDTTEATVPQSITLPAGMGSVQFSLTVVDDTEVDGTQLVTITAQAAGSNSTSAQLSVLDNDFVTLGMEVASAELAENSGTTIGTVTRNGPTNVPLVVTLASSNRNAATVDANVTIPAGASSANFTISAVDNATNDGNRVVTITASAPAAFSISRNVSVIDNDIGSLWTNKRDWLDVNNDGLVTAFDALLIINRLNQGQIGAISTPIDQVAEYIDASGDGLLTPVDALLVINRLNR